MRKKKRQALHHLDQYNLNQHWQSREQRQQRRWMVEEMWKLHISQTAVTVSQMTKYRATSAALSLSYSLNFAACNFVCALIIHHHGFLKFLKNIISPSHCSSGYLAVFKIVLATSQNLTIFLTFKSVYKVRSFCSVEHSYKLCYLLPLFQEDLGWLGNAIGYPKLILTIVSNCANILIYNMLYNRQCPACMRDGGLV